MKLYTKSRDKGTSYQAEAIVEDGTVIVKAGSKINVKSSVDLKVRKKLVALREDSSLFDKENRLKKDISFNSLSTAASFVTGRIANGNVVWKTAEGKSVKNSVR